MLELYLDPMLTTELAPGKKLEKSVIAAPVPKKLKTSSHPKALSNLLMVVFRKRVTGLTALLNSWQAWNIFSLELSQIFLKICPF